MRVDFQIVHSIDSNIKEHLLDLLKQTFDESTTINEEIEERPENLEDWSIFNWIDLKYNYKLAKNENKFITGFSLEIDENLEVIIQEFGNNLKDDGKIEVVFKYFDDAMLKNHKKYAEEIFKLEMKLREVFSFIFIDTYRNDYYNLLKEINVKTQSINGKNKPNEDYYKSHLENEFFFLLFSNYINLNNLKKIEQNDLMEMIRNSNDYNELRDILNRRGITKEKYKDLIASIKESLDPIEKMRNCIAHNRSLPDDDGIESYETARDKLEASIKDFWENI